MSTATNLLGAGAIAALIAPATALAGHTNILLEAELNGRSEVSADGRGAAIVGDPNGRGEAYVFGIDNDPTTLCYIIEVEKIQLVPVGAGMMAHIHAGAPGTNGPVVAFLAGPEDGNAADCLTEGEPGKFADGVGANIVQEILTNPEAYYINVHNPKYPGGAIRGQLENTLEHDHD